MFGLEVLDIGLGLVFLYLILSLVCTSATEIVAGVMHLRAKTLVEGIRNLLRDPEIEKEFFQHPLIKSLNIRGRNPSYIPAQTFRWVLTSIIVGAGRPKGVKEIRAAVEQRAQGNPELKNVLLTLIGEAGKDIEQLHSNIEIWFNNAMDRVTGWYKSKSQVITFCVALIVTVASNADTIDITNALAKNPALRQALVAQAEQYAKRESSNDTVQLRAALTQGGDSGSGYKPGLAVSLSVLDSLTRPGTRIKQDIGELEQLGVPLGWKETPAGWGWLTKITGLLLTTLALTLGAPFWFDILKKVVNIRSSGASSAATKDQKGA